MKNPLKNHQFFPAKASFARSLLKEAIPFTNRAYIFDNSSHEHIWLAEITNGHLLEMKIDQVPVWFKKALGSKFNIGSKELKQL